MKKQVNKKRVFVGLSGGVDSSVAAYLLKRQGYEVVGVHLRCWNRGGCDVPEAEYARRVAGHLDIPFYIFDMEDEYREAVVEYMIDGYKKGITPNPDVMCNKEIKFGLFLKKALEMGADYIATGHYVKLSTNKLSTAKDKNKDQSYFLWTLTQAQLKHSLFPIGNYTKREIRDIAKKVGLPTADKKDSQGICFIGDVDIKEFLAEYLPKKKGKILDTSGKTQKTIGFHDGIQFYTIGQRHGLGIGGGTPYYIVSKDKEANTLIVACGDNDESLYKEEVDLTNVNFINKVDIPKEGLSILCRLRYRQPLFSATMFRIDSLREVRVKSASVRVVFDSPQKFIAPGQSAVFYSPNNPKKGEVMMMGGGVIL